MTSITLPVMLFAAIAGEADVPIGYNQWQRGSDTIVTVLGAPLANYMTENGTLAPINNGFQIVRQAAVCESGNIKTVVSANGQVTLTVSNDGIDYTVTQRPIRLVWLKKSTRQIIDVIPSLSWPTPTVNDNQLSWSFSGFEYAVVKGNSSVSHRVTFKPGFLDSAVTLYNQRADSLDIMLGSVMKYDFSAIDDSTLLNTDDVTTKRLRVLGERFLDLSNQTLQYPGVDSVVKLNDADSSYVLANRSIPVRQYWRKIDTSFYCIEYVPMSIIKRIHEFYPESSIWHNATQEYGQGSNEAEDTWLDALNVTTNYGSTTSLVYYSTGDDVGRYNFTLRWTEIKDLIYQQEVSACTLWIPFGTPIGSPGPTGLEVHGGLRHWVESEATWSEYSSGNSWTSGGCAGNGTDRTTAAYGATNVADTNSAGELVFVLTDLLQTFDNTDTGAVNNFVIQPDGTGAWNGAYLQSSEHGTPSERPHIKIVYSPAGGGQPSVIRGRRRILLGGN